MINVAMLFLLTSLANKFRSNLLNQGLTANIRLISLTITISVIAFNSIIYYN